MSNDYVADAHPGRIEIDGTGTTIDYSKRIYGGKGANASSNTIIISNNVTIKGYVYGGDTDGIEANSTGNTIRISNATIEGEVYGGSAAGSGSQATGNTVELTNSKLGYVYGGMTSGYGSNSYTNNTLKLIGKNEAYQTLDFQNYHFVLDKDINSGEKALTVKAGGGVYFGPSAKLTIDIAEGGREQAVNEKYRLIDATASGASIAGTVNNVKVPTDSTTATATASGNKGLTTTYDYQLTLAKTYLDAEITGIRIGSASDNFAQAKALSEGMVGSVAFLNQASDLASGRGMDAAVAATSAIAGYGVKAASFGVAQGGHSRYKTGSHVNVDGAGIILGVAFNTDTNYGNFMLAPFIEAGWGNYGSYNSFSNAPSVSGHGDSYYYGLGSLVRFDFNDIAYGHPYVEGSLRVGHSKSDFSSKDIKDDFSGKTASYDSEGMYYGAHVGGGYVFNLTDKDTLDTYLKYFWTHQDSDTVKVLGDKVHFDDVDSSRLRAGTRYSHNVKVDGYDLKPYVGVAFEREFDGKARAKVNSYDVDAPTLKGNTGMLEVGLSFKPASVQNMSIDFGLEAYTGRREGVVGSLKAYYAF